MWDFSLASNLLDSLDGKIGGKSRAAAAGSVTAIPRFCITMSHPAGIERVAVLPDGDMAGLVWPCTAYAPMG
jgi:hypothetical protein